MQGLLTSSWSVLIPHLSPRLRNKFVRGAPVSLKSFVVVLFCRSEIKWRTATTELGNINVIEIILS